MVCSPECPLKRQHEMLRQLSTMPQKIMRLHDTDHAAECVLHDLCHANCLNLQRAAYFVDNPDFNFIRGVAGVVRPDHCAHCGNMWEDASSFRENVRDCAFNQKVRSIARHSAKKNNAVPQELMQDIAQELDFPTSYAFCVWPMKHNNHGIVLYEKSDYASRDADEFLEHGFRLLNFCPIT